jgi:hypothetical protein
MGSGCSRQAQGPAPKPRWTPLPALLYAQVVKTINHASTLTAAILDRLLHHAETVVIEGRSFRMQDQREQ